ncbi:hypothetical protein KSF_085220 [Reticulibacter mediterranei]|uniref:TIR domain-containing protein n=1 Tax=Reticulibacter mediterranei TaxID=2778369 RepID=A0A8J3IMS7_9CHLR|nr:toll/interleukin-1 receptor domain-containing protein [Reticulibacter mediterranei]GHO98474.1 hypothetical protein KSF_085220 [Reticulibacter mediterranei]
MLSPDDTSQMDGVLEILPRTFSRRHLLSERRQGIIQQKHTVEVLPLSEYDPHAKIMRRQVVQLREENRRLRFELEEQNRLKKALEAQPEHVQSLQEKPIHYYTCFISYSNKDEEFARYLHTDLEAIGVDCWFAPHDMKIGDKIRLRIDESIRLYEKLLLILSEHSVLSQWVEHEVETALHKEYEGTPNVLFPIRLDNTVEHIKTGWITDIQTRHIGNFSSWKNPDDYKHAFKRLIRDLASEKSLR